jgi:hypothetical protein
LEQEIRMLEAKWQTYTKNYTMLAQKQAL